MKKLLAIILAIAMVMSMAIVVSAASTTVTLGDKTYTESVVSTLVDEDTEIENGGWWAPAAWNSTPSASAVATQLRNDDTYLKIVTTTNVNFSFVGIQCGGGGSYPRVNTSATLVGSVHTDDGYAYYYSGNEIMSLFDDFVAAYEVENDVTLGVTNVSVTASADATVVETSVVTLTEANTTPHITGVDFSFDPEITMLYTYVDVPEDITFDNYFMLKWYSGNELLTRSIRNINRTQAFDGGVVVGAPTLIYGNYNDEAVDGWCYDSWTADVHKCPTKVELWINGSLVDTYNFDDHAEEAGVVTVRAAWNSTYITGASFEGNMPAEVDAGNANVSTGYFATGDETHAIIVNGAIITSNHVYNANGDCVYCGYHKDVVEDEVVIETPVESDTEEVDEDNTDDVEVDDKTTDTNPTTGVVLAAAPMMVATLAVVASKRR